MTSENHLPAAEGKWILGGSIELPCNYKFFRPKIHTEFVREKIKNSECWPLYHLNQLWPNGFIYGWGLIRAPCFTLVKRWAHPREVGAADLYAERIIRREIRYPWDMHRSKNNSGVSRPCYVVNKTISLIYAFLIF